MNKDWKKLKQLASLVGTDARDPNGNLIAYIEQLLKEEREEAYKKGFIDGGMEEIKKHG